MIEYLAIGGGYAFAAAAQPGPLQAFLLSKVVSVGWQRTLPAALAPLISDAPIAVLMLVLLDRVAPGFESILRGVGGIVLLYFAVKAFLDWRSARLGDTSDNSAEPRTLVQAVAVNIANPGPYIGWSLVLGPLVVQQWPTHPQNAVALIVSFYTVMVLSLGLFILIIGTTSLLGGRGRRLLLLASSLALAALGAYSILSALR